jgi:hypothetical protein
VEGELGLEITVRLGTGTLVVTHLGGHVLSGDCPLTNGASLG